MKKLLTLVFALGFSASTYAAPGFLHEIDVNLSQGFFRSQNGNTHIEILGDYSYDLGNGFQVGGIAGIQSKSGSGNSNTGLTAVATGTYNFDYNYSDAFFAKAGLGLYPHTDNKGDYKNDIGFFIAGGKRFAIWNHVNYKPLVMLKSISNDDAEFIIQFLNISLNFQ